MKEEEDGGELKRRSRLAWRKRRLENEEEESGARGERRRIRGGQR